MCQNAILERSEQIDRCVDNGMPEKIVKSVIYTLNKRIKRAENIALKTQETNNITNTLTIDTTWEPKIPLLTDNKAYTPAKELLTTTTMSTIVTEKSEIKIPKMCGRFRQQVKKDQISNDQTKISADINRDQIKQEPYLDVLSVGTAYTKFFFECMCRNVENWKQTKTFTLLTKSTQPAHLIAICILSVVLLTIWPDLIDSSTNGTTTASMKKTKTDNTLAAIAYLGAFATHFGAQIWMTFVSGLSLYFALPRHTFGQCQQILFPKYFTLNSVLSIILLVIFVKYFIHTWSLAIAVQFATLILNPVIELTIRLYLAPPMLRLMHEKYRIESAVGNGHEIGSIVQGDLTECPHYQRIHKAFRRMHMMTAIGNMTILMATCTQLYFLASKIKFENC